MRDRSGIRGIFCYHRRGGPLVLAPGLAADLGWTGDGRTRPPGILDLFAAVADADRVRVFLALHASERRATPLASTFLLRGAAGAVREVTLEGTWTRGPDGEAETLFGSLCESGGEGEAQGAAAGGQASAADRIVELAVEIGEIARAHGVAAIAQSAAHLLMQMVEKADAFAPPAPRRADGASHAHEPLHRPVSPERPSSRTGRARGAAFRP